jgi:hypothetical protein
MAAAPGATRSVRRRTTASRARRSVLGMPHRLASPSATARANARSGARDDTRTAPSQNTTPPVSQTIAAHVAARAADAANAERKRGGIDSEEAG